MAWCKCCREFDTVLHDWRRWDGWVPGPICARCKHAGCMRCRHPELKTPPALFWGGVGVVVAALPAAWLAIRSLVLLMEEERRSAERLVRRPRLADSRRELDILLRGGDR